VSADIVHASDRRARGVNITIDDGPDPVWTPQVLQVLRENGVRATFCMVGTQALERVRRAGTVSEGYCAGRDSRIARAVQAGS
jgi:peptidoglycan/xylan/chitin deacetylase (PgdA/CDA1 family)